MIIASKKITAMFALGCCVTASIFANDTAPQTAVTAETPKATEVGVSQASSAPKKEHRYNMEDKTPASNPSAKKDNPSFFVRAAYTFWAPYNSGLAVAFGNGTTSVRGNTLSPATNTVSGFKVATGMKTMHDGWNARANYTWFYHNPKFKNLNASPDYTYNSFDVNNAIISSIESKYYVQFNRVDASVSRSYSIAKSVTLNPWLGLLSAWDKQYINTDSISSSEANPNETANRQIKQDWWGIGPYAGGEISYGFTDSLGLYISSGAAILLAEHKSYINAAASSHPELVTNNLDKRYGVEPALETSFGVRWGSSWENFGISINLAWEMQSYFEHISFSNSANLIQNATIYSMQGLTLGAEVSF
jgi:hypothetical protein